MIKVLFCFGLNLLRNSLAVTFDDDVKTVSYTKSEMENSVPEVELPDNVCPFRFKQGQFLDKLFNKYSSFLKENLLAVTVVDAPGFEEVDQGSFELTCPGRRWFNLKGFPLSRSRPYKDEPRHYGVVGHYDGSKVYIDETEDLSNYESWLETFTPQLRKIVEFDRPGFFAFLIKEKGLELFPEYFRDFLLQPLSLFELAAEYCASTLSVCDSETKTGNTGAVTFLNHDACGKFSCPKKVRQGMFLDKLFREFISYMKLNPNVKRFTWTVPMEFSDAGSDYEKAPGRRGIKGRGPGGHYKVLFRGCLDENARNAAYIDQTIDVSDYEAWLDSFATQINQITYGDFERFSEFLETEKASQIFPQFFTDFDNACKAARRSRSSLRKSNSSTSYDSSTRRPDICDDEWAKTAWPRLFKQGEFLDKLFYRFLQHMKKNSLIREIPLCDISEVESNNSETPGRKRLGCIQDCDYGTSMADSCGAIDEENSVAYIETTSRTNSYAKWLENFVPEIISAEDADPQGFNEFLQSEGALELFSGFFSAPSLGGKKKEEDEAVSSSTTDISLSSSTNKTGLIHLSIAGDKTCRNFYASTKNGGYLHRFRQGQFLDRLFERFAEYMKENRLVYSVPLPCGDRDSSDFFEVSKYGVDRTVAPGRSEIIISGPGIPRIYSDIDQHYFITRGCVKNGELLLDESENYGEYDEWLKNFEPQMRRIVNERPEEFKQFLEEEKAYDLFDFIADYSVPEKRKGGLKRS